jgi:hypothetical protein
MDSKLRILVTGLIGQHPLGGVTWDYVQYPLGLARLGHDVYYLEDSGEWPYDPAGTKGAEFAVTDCSRNVGYLRRTMRQFGLGERWLYRCPIDGAWHGLSARRREEVLASADLLINVSGTLIRLHEYRRIPRLAYIDSDPVFTQIKVVRGSRRFRQRVEAHDVHFSFGESLPATLPVTGQRWLPTRQPVVLGEWTHTHPARETFTTVMNWASYKRVSWEGNVYGQKDSEFRRFLSLPELVWPTALELAVRRAERRRKPTLPAERLAAAGWRVVDPLEVCPDVERYRRYVQTSKAEWSVAKHGYVAGRPGWFSCRSACYLASGRPVVVEDTGFGSVLPVGEGIVAFSTLEEAVEGIRDVEARYARHAAAAREIAREYFDSERVLTSLVDRALTAPAASAAGDTR